MLNIYYILAQIEFLYTYDWNSLSHFVFVICLRFLFSFLFCFVLFYASIISHFPPYLCFHVSYPRLSLFSLSLFSFSFSCLRPSSFYFASILVSFLPPSVLSLPTASHLLLPSNSVFLYLPDFCYLYQLCRSVPSHLPLCIFTSSVSHSLFTLTPSVPLSLRSLQKKSC